MAILGGAAVSYERGTPVAVELRECLMSTWLENNHVTEMCSSSEAGSYLRLIDFVYHSTLGLRVIKKKRDSGVEGVPDECVAPAPPEASAAGRRGGGAAASCLAFVPP